MNIKYGYIGDICFWKGRLINTVLYIYLTTTVPHWAFEEPWALRKGLFASFNSPLHAVTSAIIISFHFPHLLFIPSSLFAIQYLFKLIFNNWEPRPMAGVPDKTHPGWGHISLTKASKIRISTYRGELGLGLYAYSVAAS